MTLTLGFYVDSVPFTRAVIDGSASLGGSESACLGLARALKAIGHDVHMIATKLDPSCVGPDHAGVPWHPAEELDQLNAFITWDVFTVLRMYPVFGQVAVPARLRLLWNQDLLTQPQALMSTAFAVDRFVYVSDFQRRQYEQRLPEIAGLGYVTRNGFDPALVPTDAVKDPTRIIHISRPERAMRPLLAMWPAFKQVHPHATLHLCRYSSMYDPTGFGRVCEAFDRDVARVNAEVGGITYLGELGKADLYRAIAASAVMWYPGVADFAETSCIAALEAQACGTPFVGSFKGALPETVPGGVLVRGDADTDAYQAASMAAVAALLEGCARSSVDYRQRQAAGRAHVEGYTYAAIAAAWDAWLTQTFDARSQTQALGVLRQLLHEDDHVAARTLAVALPDEPEAQAAVVFCDRVIAGEEQTAIDYAAHATPDPEAEMRVEVDGRMGRVLPYFEACTHVLDVACGNGAFALLLAQTYPALRVTGIDYAEGNIASARKTAERLGLADRVTFRCAPAWDLPTQTPQALPTPGGYDGLFCGEFLEHVAACDRLVDHLETALAPGAIVVYTVPSGPFGELLPRGTPYRRGHVHHFRHDDLQAVFGGKSDIALDYLAIGVTGRGHQVGHWVVHYRCAPGHPAAARPVDRRIRTTRPMARLSVGMLAYNAETDLAKCLASVWGIADEIVIGDTGSTDRTRDIATDYGARVIDLAPLPQQPFGFAGARNQVLAACTGDWFLWIDSDEQLMGGPGLGKYLESGPFKGYALHQNHLMLDAPMSFDTPVRLFRRVPEIQFFGCVHEQPGWEDANTDMHPALEITDVQIAHLGYLTEHQRRGKMLSRNLPLLQRDRQQYPARRLGAVLVLRDVVNLADYDREEAGGAMTPKADAHYRAALALFTQHFADPSDKYHRLARPWYERSLKALGAGVEIEVALGGKRGGLNGQHAKPERLWVTGPDELERLIAHRVAGIRAQMTPDVIHVDPFEEVAP